MPFLLVVLLASPAYCGGGQDPFKHFMDKFNWVLDQLPRLQKDAPVVQKQPERRSEGARVARPARQRQSAPAAAADPGEIKSLAAPVLRHFEAATSWALIKADVTDYGSRFHVAITLDQPATAFQLKLQSTKEVLLKGGLNNQLSFAFDYEQPYIRDYGLTVFVTDNSYPCFIQLFK